MERGTGEKDFIFGAIGIGAIVVIAIAFAIFSNLGLAEVGRPWDRSTALIEHRRLIVVQRDQDFDLSLSHDAQPSALRCRELAISRSRLSLTASQPAVFRSEDPFSGPSLPPGMRRRQPWGKADVACSITGWRGVAAPSSRYVFAIPASGTFVFPLDGRVNARSGTRTAPPPGSSEGRDDAVAVWLRSTSTPHRRTHSFLAVERHPPGSLLVPGTPPPYPQTGAAGSAARAGSRPGARRSRF